jgi:hypothetical protein
LWLCNLYAVFDSQASLHVWKTVVANTPKTLKEIIMRTLIDSLASTSGERRQVAFCTMDLKLYSHHL